MNTRVFKINTIQEDEQKLPQRTLKVREDNFCEADEVAYDFQDSPIALYIHIPFCPTKCHYCSFAVVTDQSLYEQYLVELKKELQHTVELIHKQNRTIRTIYFGGGTPSTLKKEDVAALLDIIICHTEVECHSGLDPESQSTESDQSIKMLNQVQHDRAQPSAPLRSVQAAKEISFELNPEHVTEDYLRDLKELGITRVSIGIQSLDDTVLVKAGRKHTRQQALKALGILSTSGIPFNVDLILGLPDSTKENFLNTLTEILTFSPSHISSYFLTIESGTPFQLLPEKELMREEVQIEIFEEMKKILLEHYFSQYEISNWAKSGYESQHNLMYWRGFEYLGVGLGAGSYFADKRWNNVQNMNLYLKNEEKRNMKSIEHLSKKDTAETYLMTALRLQEGIDLSSIESLLSMEEIQVLHKKLQRALTLNFLEKTEKGYRIPEEKRLLHNYILTHLL